MVLMGGREGSKFVQLEAEQIRYWLLAADDWNTGGCPSAGTGTRHLCNRNILKTAEDEDNKTPQLSSLSSKSKLTKFSKTL